MKVRVNGRETCFDEGTTILSLLQSKRINPSQVIVEYNYEIPGRDKWESICLKDDDNIEIVKFMGGG